MVQECVSATIGRRKGILSVFCARLQVIRTISLTLIQASEWLQFLCLGRVMARHYEDIHATKTFLPSVALCSVMINWVCFGMVFFETNLIKYQLSKPDFNFSQTTLISMIFTQTIYPADYLFM